MEGISQNDVRSWTEGIKTNDIAPIQDVISELEKIIETAAKGNEQGEKENLVK